MRVWLSLVEAVSDLTKLNWPEIYSMCAMEFFAYVTYVNYKRRKELDEIRKFKAKNKLK